MKRETMAISELRKRFDEWQHFAKFTNSDADAILVSAVRALGRINIGYMSAEYDEPPVISADKADKIVSESTLLKSLVNFFPALGSYSKEAVQLWIGNREIGPDTFNSKQKIQLYQARPLGGSLYTSSLLHGSDVSMWNIYLSEWGAKLFPRPWRTTSLVVRQDAKIYDVTSAKQWVELIKNHHIIKDSLMYPDWISISKKYDGVHLSLPAVMAIQGLRFKQDDMEIVESYWDAESTIWFSWVFEKAES